MKFLVLLPLFAALLVAGCGEKSSPEGSESASEKPTAEPSADATQETEKPLTLPLSDADFERLLEEAVDYESLDSRDGLQYRGNKPYSGWVKRMYDSGRVRTLLPLKKDGNPDGPQTMWHENGQKLIERTWKDGKLDGFWLQWHENGQKAIEGTYKDGKNDGSYREWHENGQKAMEGTYKDGELVFAKYWNSKGEEVETVEETHD